MALRNLLVVVLLSAVSVALSKPADQYTDKYDSIDLDEILNNQRLYQKYFDCLQGKGKCTPDGIELKGNLPEALKTECTKCSEIQKKRIEKVVKFIIKEKPNDYKVLEALYDSDGIYRKKYAEEKKSLQDGQ